MYVLLIRLPMGDLGRYFFKFHASLFLWLCGVSLAFRFYAWGNPQYSSAAALALAGFWAGAAVLRWLWDKDRRVYWFEMAVAALGVACIAFDTRALIHIFEPSGAKRWLLLATVPAGAMLLGSVMLAMILGHWYLVVPKLDITHLKSLTRIFIGALAARTFLLLVAMPLFWEPYGRAAFRLESLELFLNYSVFFYQRTLFGILAPWGLAYMIWNTVKMRSTQSATGILYTAVALVLLGECIGKYLLLQYGLPF